MRRVAGVLHHLEELALLQVHGWPFAPPFFLKVAHDGVDIVGELFCVEDTGQRGHLD